MSLDFERGRRAGLLAAADIVESTARSLQSTNPNTHRAITAVLQSVAAGIRIAADHGYGAKAPPDTSWIEMSDL